MTQHPVTEIARSAQPGLHLGGAVGAALCCFNCCEKCFTRCVRSLGLLQCFDEWIESVQHGTVPRLGAAPNR